MRDLPRDVGMLGRPCEPLAGKRGVAHEGRRIARPPRADADRNAAARYLAGDLDELAHRPAAPGPDVERGAAAARQEIAQRADMGVGKIGHMDVVADAGPVCGRVAAAGTPETVAS